MNPLWEGLFCSHQDSDAPFLTGPDGRITPYRSFIADCRAFAAHLVAKGLRPGDRLALCCDKVPEALTLYGACILAGVVFLPLNPASTEAEISYFLEDSEAALLVTDITAFAREARAFTPDFQPVAREGDDLAALLYTSGTTGRPKGAMLSHGNLLSNARVLASHWGFTASDVLIHALPIHHTHGLFVATNTTLAAGSSLIFLPKFDAKIVLASMAKASVLMGVPTFYTRLLTEAGLDSAATKTMRLFISGSAPLLAETHRAFAARTGQAVLERYGMTETNMICSNPLTGERRAGTVGLPLPGVDIRLVDATGQEVGPDEVGMLEVRGPNVFLGYWRQPEKTHAEFREGGWFVTGDLARRAADGYVELVGRAKDLVISGGANIYPKEVEQVLDAVPGVIETAVIGVPHPDLGEAAVAVIAGSPDLGVVQAALERELARYKHPRAVHLVAELPRNAMGKVQKALLRKEYAGQFTETDGA